MSLYSMDQMALQRVESLSLSLRKVAHLIVDKSGILKLDTWTLYELGEAFSIILDVEQRTNFHVLPIREQQDSLTANLQFAYDLLQKTKKLHIFTNPSQALPTEQVINLRCLRNLSDLDLDKVSLSQIKGLKNKRSTLQSLVVRGISMQLRHILVSCGADKATAEPWEKLKIGIFSYNIMPQLDNSLDLLPSIQVLDFSHCGLTDASDLKELQTLKHLNLSHNKLSHVPTFQANVTYSLLTLNISNNLLFDLKGLEELVNIEEVNAANNLLGLSESLIPLRQLSQLKCLNFDGNPITYNLNYRIHTLRLLNGATFNCDDFLFDSELLRPDERNEISTVADMFLPQPTGILKAISSTMQSIVSSTNEDRTESEVRPKPVWHLGPEELDDEPIDHVEEERSTTKSRRRKRNHTRFADIEDYNYEETCEQVPDQPSFGSFTYLLKNGNASTEDRISSNATIQSSHLNCMTEDHSDKLLDEILHCSPSGLFMGDQQESGDQEPKLLEETSNDEAGLDDSMLSSTDSSFQRTIEPVSRQSSDISPAPSEVEDEENDVIWMLAKKQLPTRSNSPSEEDVILVTSNIFFREKNALTNKTNAVWTVGCLESLEILSLEPSKVKINYRSYGLQNKCSIYTMAKEDFQMLKGILDPIMEKNTMREIAKTTMNCVRCEAEFPKNENTRADGKVFCPICGSGVVIMSNFEDPSRIDRYRNSMAQSTSIYERTSAEREVTPMFSETGSSEAVSICSETSSNAKKLDGNSAEASMSSVEVISENQQGDSIGRPVQAVWSVDARTPASTYTAHNELLSATKMQESSSSGSMTGSICTAVDQSSTLNTPVHHKSTDMDKCEGAKKNGSWIYGDPNFVNGYFGTSVNSSDTVYHNAATSLSHSDEEQDSDKEVSANIFLPWINTILLSLTGYSWNWWEEIVSKEECLPVVLNNPFSYNYEDPSCADHRIKLHAELILFTETDEQLLGSFKATIMTGCDSFFFGFLFISNVKFYILEAIGPEDSDLQSWLRVRHTYPYDEVTVLCSLLHNQGFAIRMSDLTAMIFFGDSHRTNNAFNFVYDCLDSDQQQVSVEEWTPRQEDRLSKQFYDLFIEEKPDVTVSLFILVTILKDEGKCSNEFLVFSCSHLMLFKADLKWYYPHETSKNTVLQFTAKEDLMNLSAIEIYGDTLLSLTFDKGDGTPANKWNIHVVSDSSMCQLIQGLKVPWSQMFGIDLEVTDYSPLAGILSRISNGDKP